VLSVYPSLLAILKVLGKFIGKSILGSTLHGCEWYIFWLLIKSSISSGYGGIYTVSIQNQDWVTQSCLLCIKTGVACI
jgi:hypothetical protein